MANRFWNFVTILVGGQLAKAADVNTNLSGIQTGFDSLEAEIDGALTVSTAPGDMTISESAAARANKLIAFDINGDIVLSTTIGTYRGNHANAASTAYYVRDVVKDAAASIGLNNLYICKTAHTSTGGLSADTANWDLLVDVASVVASEVAAAASAAAAATSYDNFDDRYLGAFTTAASPTLDNDGNAIITGALFFDTTLNRMKVRTSGATWALTTANAVDMAVADAGSYFDGSDAEAILQEVGESMPKLLATKIASASASIDFTSADGISATYRRYKVVFYDLIPSTITDELMARISQAGAFVTTATYNTAGAAAQTAMLLTNPASPFSSTVPSFGVIEFVTRSGTKRFVAASKIRLNSASYGGVQTVDYNHDQSALADTDGIQFYFSTDTISDGVFELYGIP